MLVTFLQRYHAVLDSFMRQIVESQTDQPSSFGVMLRYAMGWVDEHDQLYPHATGKRIRPILLLTCTEAAGGNWQDAIPAAAAVELLHNFSLIHDDIQDDSPLRHNRPTVWKIWGHANAINAGDALFTMAYRAIENLSTNIQPETTLRIWRIFNATALELTRGQHLDMAFEHQEVVTVDEYLSMIRGKSAALIAASAQIGALVASQNSELAAHYSEFGINLGMAFQIRDDILGIWGDPAVTGKSAATDILSRKKSLPVIYGLNTNPDLSTIYKRKDFGEKDVLDAVNALNAINARTHAEETESSFYQQAFHALEQAAPQDHIAAQLKQIVDSLLHRQY